MSAAFQSDVLPADGRCMSLTRKVSRSSDDSQSSRSASTPSEPVSNGDSSTPRLVQVQPRWSEMDESEDDAASNLGEADDIVPRTSKNSRGGRRRRRRPKHARAQLKPHGTEDISNGDDIDNPVFGDHGDRAAQTLAALGLLVPPVSDCPGSPGVELGGPVGTVATESSPHSQCHQSPCSPVFGEAPPSQNIQFHTAMTPVYMYQPYGIPVLQVCGLFHVEPHSR